MALTMKHSSLSSLSALMGIAIYVSLRQNRDMIQYTKSNVDDSIVSFNSPVTLTIFHADSRSDPSHVLSEQEFDLVFWSNINSNNNKHMLPHGPSNFVISRQFTEDTNFLLSTMNEVIRVDFRTCNEGKCPTILPPEVTDNDLAALAQYQRNMGRMLTIFAINSPLFPKASAAQINNFLQNVEAVTFWSDEYQQHIPVQHFLPKNNNSTLVTVASCSLAHDNCPEPCPQNRQEPDLIYPYLQDPRDKLCKSSHPDVNPPRRKFGGRCCCEGTCYTPEAGELNSTWPWKDAAERDFFLPHASDPKKKENRFALEHKMHTMRRTNPKYNTYQPRFACQNKTAKLLPPIFGDFQHHLFFIPEAKLVFCGIPKVGVTEWVKFFRHVMGARDYLSLPHYKEDRTTFLMSTLDHSKAEEILNDPTWTKAVFFRNPFERLLSAYMDKILRQSYTQKVFKIGNRSAPPDRRPVLTFAEFVDKIADGNTTHFNCASPNGLGACTDPHWKPQVMTCGMDQLLPRFDYIASFDHISEHTKILLERVGLWEKYGKRFDDGKEEEGRHHPCYLLPPHRGSNETSVLGFNQRGPSGAGANVHATGSQAQFSQLYTPELIKKVRAAYALDFAVWDEISSKDRPVDQIASGKDLKVVQDYCSRHQA